MDVVADHADAGRLENDLRARDVLVRGVDYAERATLHVAVPDGGLAELAGVLAELTGGTAVTEPAGSAWMDR